VNIGIDASNIRQGGGVTHIAELLTHADPRALGVDRVVVWGGAATLARLPHDREWLELVHESALDGRLPQRLAWQRFQLAKSARAADCDVLFVPGGSYRGSFTPYVTMFRNMLPFAPREMRRYAYSYIYFRLAALRATQLSSFRRADGVIFLNDAGRDAIAAITGPRREYAIVPHGVSERFRVPPRPQRPLASYSVADPYRLLYTSIIDLYKHQWNVAEAVLRLRREGMPIVLELVGPSYPPARAKVDAVLDRYRDVADGVRFIGNVSNAELPALYRDADAFVFASTCENMPNIVIEAMASGLPIASSATPPMHDILGGGALFFDAEDADSIVDALRKLAGDPALRAELASTASRRAAEYSWDRCARETFTFLTEVARR
jgi:glycosyltransferase involved in cell wall biosynthesis